MNLSLFVKLFAAITILHKIKLGPTFITFTTAFSTGILFSLSLIRIIPLSEELFQDWLAD